MKHSDRPTSRRLEGARVSMLAACLGLAGLACESSKEDASGVEAKAATGASGAEAATGAEAASGASGAEAASGAEVASGASGAEVASGASGASGVDAGSGDVMAQLAALEGIGVEVCDGYLESYRKCITFTVPEQDKAAHAETLLEEFSNWRRTVEGAAEVGAKAVEIGCRTAQAAAAQKTRSLNCAW